MKKIIAVLGCLLLLTAMTVPASAEGMLSVSVSAGNSTAYCGDLIEFHITVSGDGTCNAFGCFLEYDSSVLEYVDGAAYVDGAILSSMDSDGLVASYESPATPSGTVAGFTMRVREGAAFGETYVSLDSYTDSGSMGNADVVITVVCSHSYSDWETYDESFHQKTCGICGGTKEEEHNWNDGAVVSAPTCNTEGSKTYTCITCGEVKEEPLEVSDDHYYTSFQTVDNALHQSYCDVCGNLLTASHTWDAGKETKKQFCEETGFIKYTCTDCGHTKEEITEMPTEHSYGAWRKADAAQHTRSCSVCGKSQTENHRWNAGKTCTDCNAIQKEETPVSVPPTDAPTGDTVSNTQGEGCAVSHSYPDVWKKSRTEHWRECDNCGEKLDVANHTWDAGTKAELGMVFTCTVCRYERFEVRNLASVFLGGGAIIAATIGAAVVIILKRRRK